MVQALILPGETRKNLDHLADLVASAAGLGADIVLLPEALPFGWMNPGARNGASAIPEGDVCREFREMARVNALHLCTGLVEREGESLYNAAVLIDPTGEVILHHRKINELEIAHDLYALGDRLGVVETVFGRIGLMICADAFARAQMISRTLGMMGARVILSPCAWAVPPGHDNNREPYGKLWLDNYGPVARDFGLWIAGCSNIGPIHHGPWAGHKCIGCSLVIGPDGEKRVMGPYDREEVIILEVTPEPSAARGTGWDEFWENRRAT